MLEAGKTAEITVNKAERDALEQVLRRLASDLSSSNGISCNRSSTRQTGSQVAMHRSSPAGGNALIAWTREPSGSRASAQGDDSSTRRPNGPTMRSIRCRTDSSPSNSPSGALSIRPSRSTYTSSGPFTMTSVTLGSFSRNSMDPNPTTSSATSLTTRVSSRWGRMAPPCAQDAQRLLAHAHPALGAGCRREAARIHPLAQLIAQMAAYTRERVRAHLHVLAILHPDLRPCGTHAHQRGEAPRESRRPV